MKTKHLRMFRSYSYYVTIDYYIHFPFVLYCCFFFFISLLLHLRAYTICSFFILFTRNHVKIDFRQRTPVSHMINLGKTYLYITGVAKTFPWFGSFHERSRAWQLWISSLHPRIISCVSNDSHLISPWIQSPVTTRNLNRKLDSLR